MHRYGLAELRAFVAERVWALEPGFLASMIEVLDRRSLGVRLDADELAQAVGASHGALGQSQGQSAPPAGGAVAVLPLHGLIAQRARDVQGVSGPRGTSTEEFQKLFDAALAEPRVSAIVIDVDSPGGSVNGVPELARHITEARGTKRIVAVANGLAASAAYWLASAAEELVITPSGEAGSIGVYVVHQDLSEAVGREGVRTTIVKAGRYKAELHPLVPLSEEGREALQGRVDSYYEMFVSGVARNRGVSRHAVRTGYGEGRVLGAEAALQAGVVDRIATLDQVIAKLVRSRPSPAAGGKRADLLRRRLDLAV